MKKALVDERNLVAEVVDTTFPVAGPFHWEDCPNDCVAYQWEWKDGSCSEISPDIPAIKESKVRTVEHTREVKRYVNISALGREWQADANSQDLLGKAISLATAGLPLPTVWRDADNSNMPINSINDLLAIAGAMAVQTQAAYAWSWAKKAEIEAATTVEELAAIDLNS